MSAIKQMLKKDAEEWGNALNDAGWEFLDAYYEIMGEAASNELFNNGKAIIRRAILKYLDSLDEQRS